MTRRPQKDEERFYAMEYIRRRGIDGHVADSEHPDFVIRTSAGLIGIELVSYGDQLGRKVDSAWETLADYACKFREKHPDLNRFGVRLHFRTYHMPPSREREAFCEAIATLLRKNVDLPTRGEWRTLRIDPTEPILGRHLSRIEVYGVTFYSEWEWPTLMNGGIGTSDKELLAAVDKKLKEYRQPAHIDETHLVVYGRGPHRTRIASPISAEQLENFLLLNAALHEGPFAAVSVLCLRDFCWTKTGGWLTLAQSPYSS